MSCPGLSPLAVDVRVTPAIDDTNIKGTVVLGTGGNGVGFADGSAPMKQLISDLSSQGYRVVQRAWASSWTRAESGAGMASAACRYATLLSHIHGAIHTAGKPLCAAGNSAGGSEIAYALARYGLGSILTFAIVSGGPPMGRLDLGCLGGDGWTGQCSSVVPPELFTYSQPLQCDIAAANLSLIDAPYGNAKPCSNKLESFRDALREDSLASELSSFSYPETKVHFMYGAEDYTFATPSGHTYSLQVTSETQFSYLPGVAHGVMDAPEGGAAYYDAMVADCQ